MPRGVPHLSQRPVPGQRVTYERVPPVVNRQRLEAFAAKDLARGTEAPSQRMAGQRSGTPPRAQRRHEQLFGCGTQSQPLGLPFRQIGQRPRIPPQRDDPRTAALRRPAADADVRARGLDTDVADPQAGDFGDPQAAAAGKADQDQIEPAVGRTAGLALEVGQDGGQFAARQNLRGVYADRGAGVHAVPFANRGTEGAGQSVTSGAGGRQARRDLV